MELWMRVETHRKFFGGLVAVERVTLTLRGTSNRFVGLRVWRLRTWLCKL